MRQKSWRKTLFWRLIGKSMLQGATAVHYTSQIEQRAAETSLGLDRGVVVPLGVDVFRFEKPTINGQMQELPAGKRPFVLVLSRLHSKKGLDVLIEAFLRVKKSGEYSNWQLVLAGDGPRRYVDHLKQKIASEDAGDSVLLAGWLDGHTKVLALHQAALLALPSHHENFGLCVIEALASGVPVIVSPNVNLAVEVEAAKAGWIAAVDAVALEVVLREALSSETERGRRARNARNLADKFDWSVVGKELSTLYSSSAGKQFV